MKKPQEVEVKIAVDNVARMLATLRQNGFRVHKRRVFEQNLVLDDGQGSMKTRGLLLRLRTAGKTLTCTFKGREIAGIHKRREEREFHLDNLTQCLAVFQGLGFAPAFTYEKYRTEFARVQTIEPGIVTLDETPIGVFIELEGPARWIDHTAKEFGYARADYITSSYATLYGEWCRKRGIESNYMKLRKPR